MRRSRPHQRQSTMRERIDLPLKQLLISLSKHTSQGMSLLAIYIVGNIKNLGLQQHIVALRGCTCINLDPCAIQPREAFFSQEAGCERFTRVAAILINPILHPLGKFEFLPAPIISACGHIRAVDLLRYRCYSRVCDDSRIRIGTVSFSCSTGGVLGLLSWS